jgi:2-amino-4-hydroxy-6-hydroxymethyldihydropteridine diphosphokinase
LGTLKTASFRTAEDINNNVHAPLFVKFVDWFPYYQGIRAEFGYSTEKDQEAARMLSEMIKKKALDPKVLQRKIKGKRVIVVGASTSLEDEGALKYIKKNKKFVKIAADGAVQFLIENKVRPDIVVTDLDGNPAFLQKAEKMGATMVVHAHGDNTGMLKKLVPKFKKLVGTTQVMPVENIYNFGGFTDGDRCVFLAEEFGAKKIVLVGMDFGNTIGKYSKEKVKDPELKKQKMQAGKRLLEMLAKQSRSQLADTAKRPIKGFVPAK